MFAPTLTVQYGDGPKDSWCFYDCSSDSPDSEEIPTGTALCYDAPKYKLTPEKLLPNGATLTGVAVCLCRTDDECNKVVCSEEGFKTNNKRGDTWLAASKVKNVDAGTGNRKSSSLAALPGTVLLAFLVINC